MTDQDGDDDDVEAWVACGGATSYTGMKLHSDQDCMSLTQAVDVRPATDGERRSRDWCQMCSLEHPQENQDWSYYQALQGTE